MSNLETGASEAFERAWPDLKMPSDATHGAKRKALNSFMAGWNARGDCGSDHIADDSKKVAAYLRKYNAWRRGDDERTMDEAGIVPAELGQMIDAAVRSLERFPAMSRITLKKIEQMGGTPCGVLVRNEDGALAAVSDMGRVTWLDDYIMAPVARDEDVALPAQGDAEKKAEKEESKGDFPLKEESLIRKAARAQGDAEPVAWLSDAQETEQEIDGRPRRLWWECNKGVGTPFYTHPPKAQAVPEGFGSPAEATLGGCRCVLFGENNRHWPCPIHNSAAPQPPQEGSGDE